jgi:hypothetical protein
LDKTNEYKNREEKHNSDFKNRQFAMEKHNKELECLYNDYYYLQDKYHEIEMKKPSTVKKSELDMLEQLEYKYFYKKIKWEENEQWLNEWGCRLEEEGYAINKLKIEIEKQAAEQSKNKYKAMSCFLIGILATLFFFYDIF